MNTQTDGHPVIFHTHTGNYVHMLTRPKYMYALDVLAHTYSFTPEFKHRSLSLKLDVRSITLEIRYVTDMYADNRLIVV